MMKWLSTVKQAEQGKLVIEKMELDETGFPRPTGELDELKADSLVLALGQETDLSLLAGVPGLEIEDGVVKVGPNMMTGYAGVFAGGDMVPAERSVTVAIGHGKKAARHIDGWLRGTEYQPPPKHELGQLRHAEYVVLLGRAENSAAKAGGRPPTRDVRGGRRGPRRVQRAVRGAPLSVLRDLLLVRQLLRGVPRQRRDQARRAGRALRDRLRLLQGLRYVRGRVPVRRDRDGAGGDLSRSLTPVIREERQTLRSPARPRAAPRCARSTRAGGGSGGTRRSPAGWAARPIRAARSGSASRRSIAVPTAARSRGSSTSSPLSPSTI